MSEQAATRLVVYGSLAPGERHHDAIGHLRGQWRHCTIRGRIDDSGEYRIFTPDEEGPEIEALLFESADLPRAWAALDEFEGDAYRRTVVKARVGDDEVEATVYAGR